MEMAMDHLNGRPLHMSYDIDACDPAIAPSTGTAVRGGLNYREAHYVAEAAADTHMSAFQSLGLMCLCLVNVSKLMLTPFLPAGSAAWTL